jgi:hypothetical protein
MNDPGFAIYDFSGYRLDAVLSTKPSPGSREIRALQDSYLGPR